jgi:hypothetical protein
MKVKSFNVTNKKKHSQIISSLFGWCAESAHAYVFNIRVCGGMKNCSAGQAVCK